MLPVNRDIKTEISAQKNQEKKMKPFARVMLLTLGFGLLSAAIGVFTTPSSRAAASSILSVFVTNTASTPVPVTGNVGVNGTPNVNVANTPAVNAQQSGAWNVGINGTPSVGLAAGATVNAQQSGGWNVGINGTPSVNVANTSLAVTTPPGTTQ